MSTATETNTEPTSAAPAEAVAPTQAAAPAADTPTPREPQQRQGRGGRRDGGGRGPRRDRRDNAAKDAEDSGLIEKVVFINRCAKVVKGGRRFSFSALSVVGDGKGKIGVGYGKANEVPEAIRKSTAHANKQMVPVQIKGDTIPHEVIGEYDGGRVLLRPATTGTGLIAGGGVRAVLEAAGVKNVLTKSLGSKNHIAVVNATFEGLRKLRVSEAYKNALKSEGGEAA